MNEAETSLMLPGAAAAGSRWRNHPHLFQINIWAWLDGLSRDAGRRMRLADIPDLEWDRIRRLGFDLVYLLGIWQRSPAGRRLFRTDASQFPIFDHALPGWTIDSVVGSPFSIRDYSPDARIGSWEDVDAVRAKLHARGMRLILDFVPNHTGPDHPWITAHPDYFLQGQEADFRADPSSFHLIEPDDQPYYFVARGRDPYFAPWADTAQIDYFNPSTRVALVDQLKEIAWHCDGLRCDMAMLILNEIFAKTWARLLRGRAAPEGEFWTDAIKALPPDFLWMAEVYWDMEWILQKLGFSFTYDKRLYDRLVASDPREIRAHLSADISYQSRMARFLENHDEPRSIAAFGRDRLTVLAALIATLPGLRFFQQGQFEGRAIRLPMPLDRAGDEVTDRALAADYERILGIADSSVFHDGAWTLLPVEPADDGSHENLIAYLWRDAGLVRLVVLNLLGEVSQGRIRIGQELPEAESYRFDDLLNDKLYVREKGELISTGLYVRLEGYQGHIFSISQNSPA